MNIFQSSIFSFISWSELRKVWICEMSSGTDSLFKTTFRQNLLQPSSPSFCQSVPSCRKRQLGRNHQPICRKLKQCENSLEKNNSQICLKKFQNLPSHWKRFKPEKSCCFKQQFVTLKSPIIWSVWTSCCLKWNVFVGLSFPESTRVRNDSWRPRRTLCTRHLNKSWARSCKMETLIYLHNFWVIPSPKTTNLKKVEISCKKMQKHSRIFLPIDLTFKYQWILLIQQNGFFKQKTIFNSLSVLREREWENQISKSKLILFCIHTCPQGAGYWCPWGGSRRYKLSPW